MNKIKGTRDYYGIEAKTLKEVFNVLSSLSNNFDLEEIITPTFEKLELFQRTAGDSSDIVNKEMFTIVDRKERLLALKPEGTASAVRLALENKLLELGNKPRLFYIDSMFRYERPQKGRQREFFQYGAELFGEEGIVAEIEAIQLATEILNKLEISKYVLKINTIGTADNRTKYSQALVEYLSDKSEALSSDSKERLNNNPLRILDSKDEGDIAIVKDAPKLIDFISEENKERYSEIKDALTKLGISFEEDQNLVRGLDYYNDFVFEFVSTDEEALGSKSTIIAGGRYDSLVNKIDSNKEVPAVGFAAGIERLILASKSKLVSEEVYDYMIITSQGAEVEALKIANNLRKDNLSVKTNLSTQKINKKLQKLDGINFKYLIVLGDNEIETGEYVVKNMDTKEEIRKNI